MSRPTGRAPGRAVVRLGDIASLSTGLATVRPGDGAEGEAGTAVVGMKDVGDRLGPAADFDRLRLPTSQAGRPPLAAGDVVVTARSASVRAAVVLQEHAAVAPVLGANLFSVRLDCPDLSPDLLAAYLVHPETQATLLGVRKGTGVSGTTLRQLARLELTLPSPDRRDRLEDLVRTTIEHRERVMSAVQGRAEACAELVMRALSPGER